VSKKIMLWAILCALSVLPHIVFAQSFPSKLIRVINPAAPGGNSDVLFRLLQPKMTENLGQNLVFDYHPGGGGTLGGDLIAKSNPDGYTTGLVAASFVMNPSMIKKMPYDTLKDFTYLGLIVDIPSGLVIHPSLPVKNVQQLIQLAMRQPEQIFASSSGRATLGHLALELFNSMAHVKIVHVPYKGAGPAIIELVAGHVQLQFSSLPLLTGHLQQGRLKLIAQTGQNRSDFAKSVPTMIESGMPGYVVSSGFGLVGPALIPRPIAEKLNAALVYAVKDANNKKLLLDQGADPVGSSLEEHDAYVKSEVVKWISVVKQAGISPQ